MKESLGSQLSSDDDEFGKCSLCALVGYLYRSSLVSSLGICTDYFADLLSRASLDDDAGGR